MASPLEICSKFGLANWKYTRPNSENCRKMANYRLLFQALAIYVQIALHAEHIRQLTFENIKF